MSASTSTPAAGARLVITNQESAEQEAIHKNGENKQLHSVIKNVPFIIDLSLEGDFDRRVINFNNCTLEATLMYDTCEEKPVHYVSRRPVEYNCTVDKTSAGDKVRVECVLNVLSSQHEGAYFRLRFSAASLAQHVLSDPIRVVSKPLQLKKVKEQRKAAAAAASVEGKTTAASKKRPLSDCNSSIQDTLARIEAQQQAQQSLISSLFQTVMTQLPLTPAAASSAPNTPVSSPYYCAGNPATPSSSASPAAIFAQPATPPAKRRRLDNPAAQQAPAAAATSELQATFEGHLRGLIDSFHAITPSRRAQAVHSSVMGASATQVEKLSGLVDVLCAEGLGRTAHISLGGGSSVPSRSSQLPYHPTWQLSSASSPLVSAGADASDDDDDAATETWLSTETSPTSTSPMSPGEGQFSFNSIDVLFDPASAELPKPAAVVGDFDDDELYTELFSSQGWLLDQGESDGGKGGRGGKKDGSQEEEESGRSRGTHTLLLLLAAATHPLSAGGPPRATQRQPIRRRTSQQQQQHRTTTTTTVPRPSGYFPLLFRAARLRRQAQHSPLAPSTVTTHPPSPSSCQPLPSLLPSPLRRPAATTTTTDDAAARAFRILSSPPATTLQPIADQSLFCEGTRGHDMSRAILLNRKQDKDVIAIGGVGGYLSRRRVSQQQHVGTSPAAVPGGVNVATGPSGDRTPSELLPGPRVDPPHPFLTAPATCINRNVTPPRFLPWILTYPLTASLPLRAVVRVSLSLVFATISLTWSSFRVSSSLPTTPRAPPVVAASPVHIPPPPPLDTAAVPTPIVRHHPALHLALDSSCGV